MKLNCCFFVMIILTCRCSAQHNVQAKEIQLQYITDWGRIVYLFSPDFWDNKKEEIISRIGAYEFEKMKKNSGRNVPCQMQLFCEDVDGKRKKNGDTLALKMSRLRIYEIATFPNITQGKDWGKYSILRVPYHENKEWDKTAVWDTVYFVIEERFIARGIEGNKKIVTKPNPLVKVKDWTSLEFGFNKEDWSEDWEVQVSRQIGLVNFVNVQVQLKRMERNKNYLPAELLRSDSSYMNNETAYALKLNQLKMYKIASYANNKYDLLLVPYEENKEWYRTKAWKSDVYFFINSNVVED